MKIICKILPFFMLFLAEQSCTDMVETNQSSPFTYSDTIQLPVNNFIQSYDYKYTIHFDSVFTDSRCPMEANCVWAGVAGVRFTLSEKNMKKIIVQLYTTNNDQWSDSVIYNNLKIKLLRVTPYPSLSETIVYSDYKAILKISSISSN